MLKNVQLKILESWRPGGISHLSDSYWRTPGGRPRERMPALALPSGPHSQHLSASPNTMVSCSFLVNIFFHSPSLLTKLSVLGGSSAMEEEVVLLQDAQLGLGWQHKGYAKMVLPQMLRFQVQSTTPPEARAEGVLVPASLSFLLSFFLPLPLINK